MAKSYQLAFEKKQQEFYIKKNFEVAKNCNSRFNSNNTNMVGRFLNTVISLVNKHSFLPEFVVIVLDDDVIEFLKANELSFGDNVTGISTIFGTVFEYLAKEIDQVFTARYMSLPPKLQLVQLQVYWVSCPLHVSKNDRVLRVKWNLVMESTLKQYQRMHMIKLKNIWDDVDSTLVVKNNFTCDGLDRYWSAVDAAVEFNVHKHRDFLVVDDYNKLMATRKPKGRPNKWARAPKRRVEDKEEQQLVVDEIQKFFIKRKEQCFHHSDKYHWSSTKPTPNEGRLCYHAFNIIN